MKRQTFMRTLLVMSGLFILTVGMLVFLLFGPNTPIVVSTKTTYLTEPLDKYGRVDYFEAVRRELKKDVTVENNAAVLLWQAWGRMDLDPEYIGPHFHELGIPIPPEDGDYLLPLHDGEFVTKGVAWLQSIRDATPAGDASDGPEDPDTLPRVGRESPDLRATYDELAGEAMGHPWRSEAVPPLSDWLKENEKPIELIFEATTRPRMYSPMVRQETLLGLLLPTIQNCREAARALAVRSMWHLGEGRIEAAWQDAMACHRLARLIGQNPTLVGQLVAIAIDGIAHRLDLAILEHPRSADQLEVMRRDLASLARCSNMARSIGWGERLCFLDAVTAVAQGGGLGEFTDGGFGEFGGIVSRVSVDWNVPLQIGNECYDELAAAASLPRFADRQAALKRAEARIARLNTNLVPQRIAFSLVSRRTRSDLIGWVLAEFFLPAVQATTVAEDRSNTYSALTRVAVELAAYRAQHGEYPAKLADLGDDVFAGLPLDLFSEKPFLYQRLGEGYLLSSVGRNQQDDRGCNSMMGLVEGVEVDINAAGEQQIDPNADDFALRLPRPPFSWPERVAESAGGENDAE